MQPGELPFGDEQPPLERAFWAFHRENPKVYELFRQYALEAAHTGRKRFGARMIWNRMRWYTRVETNDPDFKLNDHHTPYYARMFLRDHPEHEGLFELRRVQGEEITQ